MHRPILTLVIIALFLFPVAAQAAGPWTTTATVPSSFRPNRSVTFTFTASSTSPTDLPVQWFVDLYTCADANGNGYCASNEPNYVAHGRKNLDATPGNSASASWSVSLAEPEGPRRYHFATACRSNPCLTEPGGEAYNKTGNFQLQFTNTWTRTILATNPTSVGSTQTIQYRIQSTSVDDRDLTGTARLYSTPATEVERDHGTRAISVLANQQQTLSWAGITFPTIGTQQLRVSDTTGPETLLNVTVRGVHLHSLQPRSEYEAGGTFSLYFTLEGHGSTPDPSPIPNNDIRIAVKSGSFGIGSGTLKTDANGRAYANVTTADDLDSITWTANASGTWLGIAFDLGQSGAIVLTPARHVNLEKNITAIRENLSEVQLKGVHLDDIGSQNVWMLSLRAVGAVTAVVLLILLVLIIAWRI